mmetsp:Transcript_16634/g.38044  ORF Transcript_16634/g.38044 Transcript_16634/m.38044 type:complete len:229 (+) Transcript_16634:276-962(+)
MVRRLRSRSSAITSSMMPERGFHTGMSERSGSSSMLGTLAHCEAIHTSFFSRLVSAASCASTAFISSSERTTSKEPMERLRALLDARSRLLTSSAPGAFCFWPFFFSRSLSRLASCISHCLLSSLSRARNSPLCSASVRTRCNTSGRNRSSLAWCSSKLRWYTGKSVTRRPLYAPLVRLGTAASPSASASGGADSPVPSASVQGAAEAAASSFGTRVSSVPCALSAVC